MGGSVVVRACPLLFGSGYKIVGVAVLDVVEGSALDALPHMHSLLNARPDGFDSPEHAIEWHVKTNTIQNPNSARVSVPSIIASSTSDSTAAPAYEWRTPLRSTAQYWRSLCPNSCLTMRADGFARQVGSLVYPAVFLLSEPHDCLYLLGQTGWIRN